MKINETILKMCIRDSFSAANHLDAAQFVLNEEERMHLRGRIDRMDTYTTNEKVYVKTVSYTHLDVYKRQVL